MRPACPLIHHQRPTMSDTRSTTRPALCTPPARHLLQPPAAMHMAGLALAAAIASMATALPQPAHAQAGAERRQTYDIAAGPLEAALTRFAKASGVLLAYPPELVRELRSPGLQGSHAPSQALALLLSGTGLTAASTGQGSYTLRRSPTTGAVPAGAAPTGAAAAGAAASATLAEVRVTASAESGSATEGTGAYTATGPSSTATGLGLTLRETPQSVTVMTRQRMDDFKLETLADVMEQTPGVAVVRQNDMTTFNVRGSGVNLQTDGSRQFSNGWGWNTHTMYALDDLAEIDRIEVLKGSSGLINGDGAYGATVNLIRKRPTRDFQASAMASAGSWGTYRADADIAGPLNADASLRGRLVASRKSGDSFRDHQHSSSAMLYGTLEYDLTPDTLLSTGITYRERRLRGAGGTTPIQGYTGDGRLVGWMPRSLNIAAPWSGYEQESLNAFARLEHRFASGWKARLQMSHEEVKTPDMQIGMLRSALPVSAQFADYRDVASRNQNISLDLQGPFEWLGRQHELLVGAGAARNRTTLLRGSVAALPMPGLDFSQGGIAIPAPMGSLAYSSDLFSNRRSYLYGAARLSLADPLKLIAGMRVTRYDQKDVTDISWYNYQMRERGVVTPYAGLVYEVSPNISVYGSYASIFKAQSAKDQQERTLAPEEGLTYEIGAKGEFFDRRLNASIAHFWMRTDNTAVEDGLMPNGDTAYRAVQGARRRGFELELSGELARGWQAQGSYATISSNLDNASTSPRHQFKLGTSYRFAGGTLAGLTVGGAARWQSAISTDRGAATLRQDAYWLLDLTARYQISRQLSISAQLYNALDRKYFAGVTNFDSQGLFYTWGAPRSFSLSMRYDF